MNKSVFGKRLQLDESRESNILMGLVIAELFNNPFSLYQSKGIPTVQNAYQIGYNFIAPVLSNFVIWLINQLKKKDYDTILFIARDGYLIKRLYDEAIRQLNLENMPKSVYFLTSRRAGISALANNKEYLRYAANLPYHGSPEEMLQNRFLIEPDEIMDFDEGTTPLIEDYVSLHRESIHKKTIQLKEGYLSYIKKLKLESKQLAIFDFVSTGTCHMCIEKIMDQKLDGLYFIHLPDDYAKKRSLKYLIRL